MDTEHDASNAEVVFVLYVNGDNEETPEAVQSFRAICRRRYAAACTLTVVDVAQRPDLAHDAQVFATPTLVRLTPKPERRFTGYLSELP